MSETTARRRRPRGEPKRLLLESAVALFNAAGYDASTREIAERAGVSVPLLFKHFGSKAGLFREAMVTPFVEFVDEFVAAHERGVGPDDDPEEVASSFIGGLYDIFSTHRGLVAVLWAASTNENSELAAAGPMDDLWAAFDKLVRVGKLAEEGRPARNEIATRAIVSMVAGMAVADRAFKGGRVPKRQEVVEEMTMISLYGRMRTSGT
jgi:AcrR family transcriptional regulator